MDLVVTENPGILPEIDCRASGVAPSHRRHRAFGSFSSRAKPDVTSWKTNSAYATSMIASTAAEVKKADAAAAAPGQ